MSKRGKDTEWDASRGMEEIHEFCFKDFAAVCLFWNFFVVWSSYNITYHPKDVYAYCGSSILLFFHIRKLCILRQPYQIDGSDRTISLLGYDDL